MSDQGNTFNVLDYYGPPPLSPTYSGAFQLAIAAASSNGGTVWMPPGTYDITAAINPVSNVTLTGYGARLVSSVPPAGAVFSSTRSTPLINVTILGFTIDLGTNAVGGGAIAFTSIGSYSQDMLIRDVDVLCSSLGTASAISVGYVYETNFTDNHSQRVHVDHCTFSYGSTGSKETLLLVSCDESSISNCYFYNVSTVIDGVNFTQCVGVYGYCNGVAVRGNVFRACNGSIMVTQSQNVVLENNIMRNGERADNLNWDIALRNCQNVQVLANSLQGKTNSQAIVLHDFGGPKFDGHPTQFPNASDLVIGSNLIIGYTFGILGSPADPSKTPPVTANQSNVAITNNLFIGNMHDRSLPGTVTPTFIHDNP